MYIMCKDIGPVIEKGHTHIQFYINVGPNYSIKPKTTHREMALAVENHECNIFFEFVVTVRVK